MRILSTFMLTAMTGTTLAFVGPQTTPENRGATVAPGQGATSARADDRLLASWLLVDNENEIALAELAKQRASDPEVKAFAQKMIDDHRQMATKLMAHAGSTAPGAAG